MAYTIEHALFVASQLEKLATYNAHQLAGQLENLDFWVGEAVHAIHVIEDYPRRFALMRDAQVRWVEAHGTVVSPYCGRCGGACEFGPIVPPPPTRIPSAQIDAALRAVRDGTYHLVRRLYRAGWIDETRLRAECDRVGTSVDLADLEKD